MEQIDLLEAATATQWSPTWVVGAAARATDRMQAQRAAYTSTEERTGSVRSEESPVTASSRRPGYMSGRLSRCTECVSQPRRTVPVFGMPRRFLQALCIRHTMCFRRKHLWMYCAIFPQRRGLAVCVRRSRPSTQL